jgi:hypothetical protein
MRSSAIRSSASIASLYKDMSLSWVSSGIEIKERAAREGFENDARHSHVFPSLAFHHITATAPLCSISLQVFAFSHPFFWHSSF